AGRQPDRPPAARRRALALPEPPGHALQGVGRRQLPLALSGDRLLAGGDHHLQCTRRRHGRAGGAGGHTRGGAHHRARDAAGAARAGRRCRLMGGFYPMPAGQTESGWDLRGAPARAGRARVTLRTPRALGLVVNGEPVVWPGAAAAVTVESADVPYPTIVTDRVLRADTITVNHHLVRVLHRNLRPPGSEDQALPYVREDIVALVLKTAERALKLADPMVCGTPCTPTAIGGPAAAALSLPLTLIAAPLRHQLVEIHGNVILV